METILCGDALEQLRTLEPESVHTCVTSPPYYNLRDYGAAGQIGMEETPEEYIAKLVDVFREVRRVLRPDGTLWVNIGDSYATRSGPQPPANTRNAHGHTRKEPPDGYKCKDLMGIPWLLAFALRADGWYLRQDIIWHKTNAMPESVQDRCTKAHEYIFLLSKSAHYYFDAAAIREPCGKKGNARTFRGGGAYTGGRSFQNSARVERESHGNTVNSTGGRNKRSVWSIATGRFKAAHYATFPERRHGGRISTAGDRRKGNGMSDKLRTALKGGGRIIISVDRWANGDFHLCVTEDWARLTSIERAAVSAEAVNAAEDPDGLIGAEIAKLVAAAHISYEAKEKPPAPGADNTAQVAE